MSAIADFGVSLLILWRLRTRGLREIRPKPVGRLDLPTGATRVHAPRRASRKAAIYPDDIHGHQPPNVSAQTPGTTQPGRHAGDCSTRITDATAPVRSTLAGASQQTGWTDAADIFFQEQSFPFSARFYQLNQPFA